VLDCAGGATTGFRFVLAAPTITMKAVRDSNS